MATTKHWTVDIYLSEKAADDPDGGGTAMTHAEARLRTDDTTGLGAVAPPANTPPTGCPGDRRRTRRGTGPVGPRPSTAPCGCRGHRGGHRNVHGGAAGGELGRPRAVNRISRGARRAAPTAGRSSTGR